MSENGSSQSSQIPFIIPSSETAFRMGLKKSAFSPKIYKDLPIDYYLPLFKSTYDALSIHYHRVGFRLAPKLYQIHDASLMHYQDYETVVQSLRKQQQNLNIWQKIVSQHVKTSEFFKLNQVTQNSQELSALAGAKFVYGLLSRLFNKIYYDIPNAFKNNQYVQNAIQQLLKKHTISEILSMNEQQLEKLIQGYGPAKEQEAHDLAQAILYNASYLAKEVANEVLKDVQEFKEAKEEAQNAMEMIAGAGGSGFSHDALSVMTYLRDPDEFRKRVRLIRDAYMFMQRFIQITPSSLSQQQIVSMVGGISGVDRMLQESQLKDILPQELASLSVVDPKLRQLLKLDFLLRLSQRQVMVYQHSATMKPVIFIDKSGSMAGTMYDNVSKISIASGLALAMYIKYGADIYLFDTEVEGPVSRSRIVDLLLRIQADGGTRISEVLNKILEIGKKDYIYIVITDGIDTVDDQIIRKIELAGLKQNIRFIIVPYSTLYKWLENFKYVYVKNVAEFEKAGVDVLR